MKSLRNIWFLALSTFTEGIRHKALWAIVCVASALATANISIAQLFSWDIGKVSVEVGLSAISLTGLLLVFFLGLKILADDLERSRIFLIMSRPVTGWEYTLGKFAGLCMILLSACIILGLAGTLCMKYALWQFPAYVPPDFSWRIYGMALICQWLALLIMLAVSFLSFSFASNHFVALLLAISVYLLGQNMELLRRVVVENVYAGVLSGQEKMVIALSWIIPNLSLFDKKSVAAYGLAFSNHEFWLLVAYAFTYSALLLCLSVLFFNRRELT